MSTFQYGKHDPQKNPSDLKVVEVEIPVGAAVSERLHLGQFALAAIAVTSDFDGDNLLVESAGEIRHIDVRREEVVNDDWFDLQEVGDYGTSASIAIAAGEKVRVPTDDYSGEVFLRFTSRTAGANENQAGNPAKIICYLRLV